MMESPDKLKTRLSRLSAEDRAELARFLIDSLDEGADNDAEPAWDIELQRRWEEIRSGEAHGEPAADVFARLRNM